MSSSGRYQSQVMSFLSQQSLKVRDRTLRGWRQVKLAATWSVQVVLYPLYVGFQTTRLVSRQISRTARRVFPALRAATQAVQQTPDAALVNVPPASDTPIRRTLQSLQTFAMPITLSTQVAKPLAAPRQLMPDAPLAIASSSLLAPSQTISLSASNEVVPLTEASPSPIPQLLAAQPIHGIASLLETRRLVLVDIENRIQDILTPQQDVYLRRRIVWELADFWREQRRLAVAQGMPLGSAPAHAAVLPLPHERETMLLPIRYFRRVMTWMQTSPVATSVNLFQESRLLSLPSATSQDSDVPSVEFGAIEPGPSPSRPSRSPWGHLLAALGFSPPSDTGNTLPGSMPDPWFDPDQRNAENGWLSANDFSELRMQQELAKPVAFLPSRDDPHLVSSPLSAGFANLKAGLSQAMNRAIARISRNTAEPEGDRSLPRPGSASADATDGLEQFLAKYLTDEPGDFPDALMMRQGKIQGNLEQIAHQSDSELMPSVVLHASSNSVELASEPADTNAEISPSWIDAKATLVHYEKHPLEQLLEWVDVSMFWVEQQVTKFFKWLRSHLQ